MTSRVLDFPAKGKHRINSRHARIKSTCAWRGWLTHAGCIAVGIRGLLTELLLCAALILVGIFLVFDKNFSQKVHRTG